MKKNVLLVILILVLGAAGYFAFTFKMQNNNFKEQEKIYLQKITSLTLNNDMLSKDLSQSMNDFVESQKKIKEGENLYKLVNDRCDMTECLTNRSTGSSSPVGLLEVTGYYTKVEQSAYGETKTCDSFVILEGSPTFQNTIKELVQSGNSIHSLDANGRPVITLNMSDLGRLDQLSLSRTSASATTTLSLFLPSQRDAGAPICYSAVKILGIKE